MCNKAVKQTPAVCPLCGRTYTAAPALSRDGRMYICPDCGTREALTSIGISEAEQELILQTVHQHQMC